MVRKSTCTPKLGQCLRRCVCVWYEYSFRLNVSSSNCCENESNTCNLHFIGNSIGGQISASMQHTPPLFPGYFRQQWRGNQSFPCVLTSKQKIIGCSTERVMTRRLSVCVCFLASFPRSSLA